MKNEVLNLKERMTGYIGGYGGRNTQGEWYNYNLKR